MKRNRLKLSVWQLLSLGYLTAIILGSILLILPFATKQGGNTTYINALFTSASSVCVTGLAPYDTGTHWSLFGQIVILLMVQLGGLGFMTFVSIIFQMFGRGMSVYGRRAVMTSAGGRKLSGVTTLVRRIFIGTAICELAGACLLAIRFIPDFGAGEGIYYSVWHSVTAFCNAGFDLMGKYGGASLSDYALDPLVNVTISALIIIGGLGFCVWGDVIDCKFNIKKFQLNTKVVLFMNTLLIVIGTVLFMVFEWYNPEYAGFNFGDKLLVSFFNSVSPRTAGFYTTDPSALSDSGYLLTVILMFIGGSSGSTAGGIKVGTFAVIVTGMVSVFRGRVDINFGKKRRIEYSLLSQALAILTACLMIALTATLIICAIEPDSVGFKGALFECVSALGTVGLTLGVTAQLGITSRIILILLMYAGRVGILTLALALGEKRTATEVRKPVDTLLIG